MKKVLFFTLWLLMLNSAFGQIRITDNGVLVYPEILTSGVHNIDYSFGNVATGSTKDVVFTITNTAANFQLGVHTSSMQTTGPYSIVSLPATNIASAGGNSTFTIRFAPTATSGDSGTLYMSMAFTNQILTLWTFGSTNTAPAIAGTVANQAVNDNATVALFSAVSITDADGDNVSATITLDAAAKGVLTGTGLSDDGGGAYSIASTTVSDLQTKLQALIFNPTDNRSSTAETTTFTLAVNDGTDTSTDNTTTVVSSAVAPVVSSITLSGSPAANATSVDYLVTFSESVSGVDAADFSLTFSGVSGSISNVSGSGSTRTVTVSSLSGVGTIRLDLNASGTAIIDIGGKAINGGFTGGTIHNVSVVTSAIIAASVYLEGAYSGTNLSTAINSSIPLTQPYSINGHSGGTATTIPANAVDWVLVELREAGSAAVALNSTKVGSAAGFLMSDGSIKATDGTSNLTISLSGNTGSDFYIVIYHRNHLPIMSANAISQSSGVYTIDFTSIAANTYQGTTALSTLASGKFAMPAGDADGDGDVDAADLTTWRIQNGVTFSYNTTNGDFNLDGAINAVDRNDFQKKNTSKTRQVPST